MALMISSARIHNSPARRTRVHVYSSTEGGIFEARVSLGVFYIFIYFYIFFICFYICFLYLLYSFCVHC